MTMGRADAGDRQHSRRIMSAMPSSSKSVPSLVPRTVADSYVHVLVGAVQKCSVE